MRPLLLAALALALPGAAAAQGEEPPGSMRAARLVGDLVIDGRLDEPGWRQAPPFSDFVQSFPDEGKPASERTEVRVLHDARMLYVGVRCWDSRPAEIVRPLGRRDRLPVSDAVYVMIDANRDRRTGALFALTAGNVQADALIYDDDRTTTEWDAVWDGAVAILADGWSAEFAIPFSALRFPDAPAQRWGFGVQRLIQRNHEKAASVLFPRNGRGTVSRLGELSGIEGVRPGLDLEVTPYLAARLRQGPLHVDPASPRPRVLDAMGDLGADLTARLGSRLNLAAAVNPDFGQVEADQIILNLSTFEPYFPEKRPFFNQGLDLFQPPGAGNEARVPQQVFYSRRIGLDAPILGAAKLVGRVADRVQIGLLDALVAGTGQAGAALAPSVDDAERRAGRGLRWSWAEPLHLAADRTYPAVTPAPVNHLAGVVRVEAAERLHLGLQATSALPLRSCRLGQAELDALPDLNQVPGACLAIGGNALAADLYATSASGEWYAYGQAAASQVTGGPPLRLLPDGTGLRPGDAGLGGYLRAGRRAGEPWRFEAAWSHASPRLDLNASGYQRTQNEQEARATLTYARPSGGGPWHEWTFQAVGYGRWTTDGRGLARGRGAFLYGEGLYKPLFAWVWAKLAVDDTQYDVREIVGTGIPLHRPAWVTALAGAASDESRPVYVQVEGNVSRNVTLGSVGLPWGWSVNGEVALRPHPRVETRLAFVAELSTYALHYLGTPADLGLPDDDWRRRNWPDGTRFFGALRAPDLSLVLRQLLVLTPRLTFQVYAQLFAAAGRYGNTWAALPSGTAPVEQGMLRPVAYPAGAGRPDFHETRLVVNAVLRWELRPGSVLYAVYGRDQAELPWAGPGAPAASAFPRALGPGPTTDTFLLKWSVWLGT